MSDPSKIFEQMLEQTAKMGKEFAPDLEALKGAFDPKAFEALMPGLSKSFMDMAFGKAFNADGLDAKVRFLVTIAGLSAQVILQVPQLKLAIASARVAEASKQEINETIFQMSIFGGMPTTTAALSAAQEVFDAEENGKDK
jgi:4-carboxymuconolactone decarboxylase